ncbi:hypothetical protein M5E87_22595 [Flavonifractor plautii]|nr:hypothetical protein M5E87_22595 [Flavonifractor plautii]
MEGILYLLQEFKGKVVLFGISDVVDIAIMAFLIYKVIVLMRRTNSGAVAKGVLLLLFALGVSTFFHPQHGQLSASAAHGVGCGSPGGHFPA